MRSGAWTKVSKQREGQRSSAREVGDFSLNNNSKSNSCTTGLVRGLTPTAEHIEELSGQLRRLCEEPWINSRMAESLGLISRRTSPDGFVCRAWSLSGTYAILRCLLVTQTSFSFPSRRFIFISRRARQSNYHEAILPLCFFPRWTPLTTLHFPSGVALS